MSVPKVTVIIPTFNRRHDLVRAVSSALDQTLPPSQVLVIDDGSTDDTADIALRMPPPVSYVCKANGGVSSARNMGLTLATGEFVAFLDSDDTWDPAWLQAAIEGMGADPEIGASTCTRVGLKLPDGTDIGTSALPDAPTVALPDLLEGWMMGSNVVVRRSLLDQIGSFDESLGTGEDIDFALRIAALSSIRAIPQRLVFITRTPGSLSKSINTGNRLRVYDRFEERFPAVAARYGVELTDARVSACLGYARDLLWARDLPGARARIRQAWGYKPTAEAALLAAKSWLLFLSPFTTRH